jgi:hypothetical protein
MSWSSGPSPYETSATIGIRSGAKWHHGDGGLTRLILCSGKSFTSRAPVGVEVVALLVDIGVCVVALVMHAWGRHGTLLAVARLISSFSHRN